MENQTLKISQVGVGYWGPNLLRNFISSPSWYVELVVEASKQRREFVKNNYPQLKLTSNLDDAINNSEIDAICLATPADTHFELSKKILKAKKHLLVEKPLASTVSEVRELNALAKKHNVVLMAGHTFIYNAAVRYLKNLIDSGELGEVRYLYFQRLNLGRIRSDIDALWNLAPHDISIAQYLFDDLKPISVKRHGMSYIQKGVDDVVFLNLTYPNGVMANIHVSWLDPHKTRKTVIVGSKKMVVYDDVAENKVTIYDKGIDRLAELGSHMDYDEAKPLNFNYRSGDIYVPKIDFKEPLKTEIEHFSQCIRFGVPCQTGPEHAEGVVEILESATKEEHFLFESEKIVANL